MPLMPLPAIYRTSGNNHKRRKQSFFQKIHAALLTAVCLSVTLGTRSAGSHENDAQTLPRKPLLPFAISGSTSLSEQTSVGQKEGGLPTCAVLADGVSPLQSLLEAGLLESKKASWLERDQIEAVLKEQSLQAAFGADATSKRTAIGKLLKADLLVLMRPIENLASLAPGTSPSLELVVCETSQGLRLCRELVTVGEDPQQTVVWAVARVEQAIDKYDERITRLWAVPPLVCEDLLDDQGYLRQAYARLLEQVLLREPGSLVVELEEARSIGTEVELTAPDNGVRRRLPFYLLGSYRSDDRDGLHRVAIELELQQGGKTLRKSNRDVLVRDDVPDYLRQTATEWRQSTGTVNSVLPDSRSEAQQLAQRAKTFAVTGRWPEAYALAEASLLLAPNEPDTLLLAYRACGHICGRCGLKPKDWYSPQRVAYTLQMQERSWELAERFLVCNPDPSALSPFKFRLYNGIDIAAIPDTPLIPLAPETNEVFRNCQTGSTATMLRIVRHLAKLRDVNPTDISCHLRTIGRALGRRRQFDDTLVLSAVKAVEDSAHAELYTRALLDSASFTGEPTPADFELFDRLQVSSNPGVQKAVDGWATKMGLTSESRQKVLDLDGQRAALSEQRNRADQVNAMTAYWKFQRETLGLSPNACPPWIQKGAPPPNPPEIFPGEYTSDGVRFRPIKFRRGPDELLDEPLRPILDIVSAGNGIDLIQTPSEIHRINDEQELELLWSIPPANPRGTIGIRSVHFDGKFLWVSTSGSNKGNPMLVIIQPKSGQWWEITREGGLPLPPEDDSQHHQRRIVEAFPVGHGKACVVTSFDRTWVGMVSFAPGREIALQTLHESSETPFSSPTNKSEEAWQNPLLAFRPRNLLVFDNGQDADRRKSWLLVFREAAGDSYDALRHPLLLGLHDRKASVVEESISANLAGPNAAAAGESLYVVDWQRGLLRYDLPQLEPTAILEQPKKGLLMIDGDRFHIVNGRWTTGNLAKAQVEIDTKAPWTFNETYRENLGCSPPEVVRLCRTNRYGIVALTVRHIRYRMKRRDRILVNRFTYSVPYQVVLPNSKFANTKLPAVEPPTAEELKTQREIETGEYLVADNSGELARRNYQHRSSDHVQFRRVEELPAYWVELFKCTDRMDMMYHPDAVMIMREPGKPEIVYRANDIFGQVVFARFDGKYIWMCTVLSKILVVTPDGEKVCQFDMNGGLPQYHTPPDPQHPQGGDIFINLQPLGPGRVLAMGSFGWQPTLWMAKLTVPPQSGNDGKPKVENFFSVSAEVQTKSKGPSERFRPAWIRAYHPRIDSSRTYYLVGRKTNLEYSAQVMRRPLVVDPEKLTVRELPLPMSSFKGNMRCFESFCHEGTLLYRGDVALEVLSPYRDSRGIEWKAHELPNTSNVSGRLFPYQGKVLAPGEHWYRVEPGTWKVERLTKHPLPEQYQFREYAISAHYGLVAYNPPGPLYQVRLD